jgi:hypothetical protein
MEMHEIHKLKLWVSTLATMPPCHACYFDFLCMLANSCM